MKKKTKKPIILTTKNLLKACDLAEKSMAKKNEDGDNGLVKIPGDGKMSYCQDVWHCGTSCCLHGFAGLLRGMTKKQIKTSGDNVLFRNNEYGSESPHYGDLGFGTKLKIWRDLCDPRTKPSRVRRVILSAMKRRKKRGAKRAGRK